MWCFSLQIRCSVSFILPLLGELLSKYVPQMNIKQGSSLTLFPSPLLLGTFYLRLKNIILLPSEFQIKSEFDVSFFLYVSNTKLTSIRNAKLLKLKHIVKIFCFAFLLDIVHIWRHNLRSRGSKILWVIESYTIVKVLVYLDSSKLLHHDLLN